MLTHTAGVQLAPHQVLVVGVGPGAVATPLNLSTMQDPALLVNLNNTIPLGRMARPEEIASPEERGDVKGVLASSCAGRNAG